MGIFVIIFLNYTILLNSAETLNSRSVPVVTAVRFMLLILNPNADQLLNVASHANFKTGVLFQLH